MIELVQVAAQNYGIKTVTHTIGVNRYSIVIGKRSYQLAKNAFAAVVTIALKKAKSN